MATTAETSRTFKAVAAIAMIMLIVAAALAFLQSGGAGASSSSVGQLEAQATQVLEGQAVLEELDGAAATASASVDRILEISDPLLDVSGATAIIQEFQQRAARIAQSAPGIAANPDAADVAAAIAADATFLRTVVSALAGDETNLDIRALSGSGQEDIVAPLTEQIDSLEEAVSSIGANVASAAGLREAGTDLAATAARVANATGSSSPLPDFLQLPWIPIGLIGLAILLIVFLIVLNMKSSQCEVTGKEQAEQNERNQQAILRPVSYTHQTLPTTLCMCRSRWSP